MTRKFDIFISYRRNGGYDKAKLLYDRLRLDGYSVSFDIDTLERGNFDNELENRVKECKDFLAILNPGVFDRFFDPNYDPADDWLHKEISCALAENKNIVPLVLDGFEWPKNPLPPDVKDLMRKNGIDLSPKYFEAVYVNLKQRFLISQPSWTVKHKKKFAFIFSVLFLTILSGVAYLYSTTTERQQEVDFLAKELDSLTKEYKKMDSITRYRDSTAKAKIGRRKQDSVTSRVQVKKPAGKSSKKSLHWAGSNDMVVQEIFEKLAPAGIQKTACSGDGINIKVTKPKCEEKNDKIECSYSPVFTLTDCNNKLLSTLNINMEFRTEPQNNEAEAKKELANEVRSINFRDLISEIEGYK